MTGGGTIRGRQVSTTGPDETRALAGRLAHLLAPGDAVLLGGTLGAGKTTFTKGLAEALGVEEVVTSPTFTLVRSYPTAAGWRLLHADVYRLEQLQEVIDLALPEQLEEDAAAVIEWGERAAPALAPEYLSVTIDFGDQPDERTLRFELTGERWAERAEPLWRALDAATAGRGAARP